MMDKDSIKKRARKAKLTGGIIIGIAGAILAAVISFACITQIFDWTFWLYTGLAAVIIVGVSVSLKNRLKEIEGGEEDEASKY